MNAYQNTPQPFWVMTMLGAVEQRRNSGLPVYPLEAGQPFAPMPPKARAAALECLGGQTRLAYTPSTGLPKLQQALSSHYQQYYQLTAECERFIITPGSSGAFILAFLAAFEEGARIGVAVPGYPAYATIIRALGRVPVPVRVSVADGYRLTPEAVRAVLPLDGLVVASPANPTGSMQSPQSLRALAALARENSIRLVADELYHGIIYGTVEQETLLRYAPDALVVGSFSKYFAMPGARVGWLLLPENLQPIGETLIQSLFLAAPTLSQNMALAALSERGYCDDLASHYRSNRELLLERLPKLGFTALSPMDGAFYVYADARHVTNDSLLFCQRLLAETGVALAPGIDFEPEQGQTCVRFSYAGSAETVRQALDILAGTPLGTLTA